MKYRLSAFTLVELMVAMMIISILGVLTMSIISATDRSSSLSNRSVEASAQARLAFDRIGIDLRGLLKRQDVNFETAVVPVASTGDALRFVSMVTSAGAAAADNRDVSVVTYRIQPNVDNASRPCLVRGAKAIRWADIGYLGVQANGLPSATFPTAYLPVYPADFDVLADGVIRMVIGFQLYPDNLPVTLADGTSLPVSYGDVVYSPPVRSDTGAVTYVDTSRISSIIVGLVTIDLTALRQADATQLQALAATFPMPDMNRLPVQSWANIANNVNLTPSSVPLSVRQALRVFERAYPMTPFGKKTSGSR